MSIPRHRPRNTVVGAPAMVGHLETLKPGELVIIRDALGKEHEREAVTGPVWGFNFAVVWVTGVDRDQVPWPLEDVRRPVDPVGGEQQ